MSEPTEREITAQELAHELLLKKETFLNQCMDEFEVPMHVRQAMVDSRPYKQDYALSWLRRHEFEVKEMVVPHTDGKGLNYSVIFCRGKTILKVARFVSQIK